MRKHLFMVSLLTLFILSCSQNDETTTTEPVNSVLAKTSFKKQVENLTTNVAFKNLILNRFNPSNLKSGKLSNNQSNGAFVVQYNLNLSFGFFKDGNLIFVGSTEPGTLRILPNGLAHFQYKTTAPYCDIVDANWNTLYSNYCYEVGTGEFFLNFISAYEKFEFEWGGEITTIYFPTDLQSSTVLKMNTTVNNAFQVYDEDWNWIGCTDATEEKNVTIKYVQVGNIKANPVLQIDID